MSALLECLVAGAIMSRPAWQRVADAGCSRLAAGSVLVRPLG